MNDFGTGSAPAPDFNDRDAWFRAAQARVRAPGLLMQIFATIVIAFAVMNGALSLANPSVLVDWQYDMVEKMQKDQPPAQRQKLPPRDEAVKSQQIQGPIYAVLWIVAGTVMFIGGMRIR